MSIKSFYSKYYILISNSLDVNIDFENSCEQGYNSSAPGSGCKTAKQGNNKYI